MPGAPVCAARTADWRASLCKGLMYLWAPLKPGGSSLYVQSQRAEERFAEQKPGREYGHHCLGLPAIPPLPRLRAGDLGEATSRQHGALEETLSTERGVKHGSPGSSGTTHRTRRKCPPSCGVSAVLCASWQRKRRLKVQIYFHNQAMRYNGAAVAAWAVRHPPWAVQ